MRAVDVDDGRPVSRAAAACGRARAPESATRPHPRPRDAAAVRPRARARAASKTEAGQPMRYGPPAGTTDRCGCPSRSCSLKPVERLDHREQITALVPIDGDEI